MSEDDYNKVSIPYTLLIITLVMLILSTIYYQQNFGQLNDEYYEKLENLKKMEKELNQKSLILNQTREELSLKSERETEFTDEFTKMRTAKESCQQQLNSCYAQLSTT